MICYRRRRSDATMTQSNIGLPATAAALLNLGSLMLFIYMKIFSENFDPDSKELISFSQTQCYLLRLARVWRACARFCIWKQTQSEQNSKQSKPIKNYYITKEQKLCSWEKQGIARVRQICMQRHKQQWKKNPLAKFNKAKPLWMTELNYP